MITGNKSIPSVNFYQKIKSTGELAPNQHFGQMSGSRITFLLVLRWHLGYDFSHIRSFSTTFNIWILFLNVFTASYSLQAVRLIVLYIGE